MRYIGIDVGVTGAVAVLDGPRVVVHDLPTTVTGKGTVKREINGYLLSAILDMYLPAAGAHAIVERTSAMPGQGVASMFSMGVSRGVVLGVLGALAISYVEAAPAQWKRHFNLLGKDKDASRTLALATYPKLAPDLARVKDHNRAEAVLLAHYLMETSK